MKSMEVSVDGLKDSVHSSYSFMAICWHLLVPTGRPGSFHIVDTLVDPVQSSLTGPTNRLIPITTDFLFPA